MSRRKRLFLTSFEWPAFFSFLRLNMDSTSSTTTGLIFSVAGIVMRNALNSLGHVASDWRGSHVLSWAEKPFHFTKYLLGGGGGSFFIFKIKMWANEQQHRTVIN